MGEMEQQSGSADILVVDDDEKSRELIGTWLETVGFHVRTAEGGQSALAECARQIPELVILDVLMPHMSGFELCAKMRAMEAMEGTPILMVTALGQVQEKERAIAIGADDFLTKPVDRSEILTRVRTLLKVRHLRRDLERTLAYLHELETVRAATLQGEEETSPPPSAAGLEGTILLVEDEKLVQEVYGDLLRHQRYDVHMVGTGSEAIAIARDQQQAIDVVLLDLMMPGMSGLEVLAALKEIIPETPVIVVTAHPSSHNAIRALQLGAFDFIVKGFKNEVMLHAVSRAVELSRLRRRNRTLLDELRSVAGKILQG
ncbi:MAG: response regulator [Candidatus Methylomirabilales bacterium]